MTTERTLFADLDKRICNSPRFHANSVGDYFRDSKLDWWKPIADEYINQEKLITKWLNGKYFKNGLELGPGFGRITKLIAPRIENLTLVEINNRAAKKLKYDFPSASLLNKAVENFKDWQGTYGLVVAVEILVHIPNLPDLLNAIKSSLDHEGLFITSITSNDFYKNKRTIIHRGINPSEFTDALNKRNLSVIEEIHNENNLLYLIKYQG